MIIRIVHVYIAPKNARLSWRFLYYKIVIFLF